MADFQPPAAAYDAEKPAPPQSKDAAAMGYPVTADPATPTTDRPLAYKRPRAWLYSTAIGLALAALIAQAIFMSHKLYYNYGIYYAPSYYTPTYYTPYYGRRHLTTTATTPIPTPATATLPSLPTTNPLATPAIPATPAATPAPAPTTRKLLKKSGGSKRKGGKYKGGGGSSSSGYYLYVRGKDFATAPGMVIAASVLALLAAVPLFLLLVLPRLRSFATHAYAPVAEAGVAAVMAILWLVSFAVSAKTASDLNDDAWKDAVPGVWVGGNAIALVCGLLSMLLWGALAALAIKTALPLLKSLKDKASAAAAAPKKADDAPAAAAPQGSHPSHPGGAPAPVAQDHAYAAAAPPPHQAEYPPAAPAGQHSEYPTPAPGVYNPAYTPAPPQEGAPGVYNPAYAPGGPGAAPPAGQYGTQPAAPPAGTYPPPSYGA